MPSSLSLSLNSFIISFQVFYIPFYHPASFKMPFLAFRIIWNLGPLYCRILTELIDGEPQDLYHYAFRKKNEIINAHKGIRIHDLSMSTLACAATREFQKELTI
jgi:hypothetical protein